MEAHKQRSNQVGVDMRVYLEDVVRLDSETVRLWLEEQREDPTNDVEFAAIQKFAAECEREVGKEWQAHTPSQWREYCAELAVELYGEAQLQRAWDDDVWAEDCLVDAHVIVVDYYEYMVTAM